MDFNHRELDVSKNRDFYVSLVGTGVLIFPSCRGLDNLNSGVLNLDVSIMQGPGDQRGEQLPSVSASFSEDFSTSQVSLLVQCFVIKTD